MPTRSPVDNGRNGGGLGKGGCIRSLSDGLERHLRKNKKIKKT